MLYSNASIKKIKNVHEFAEKCNEPAMYSCVGENGILLTRYSLHVCEGLNCLVNPEVKMFQSESAARIFACSRYLEKNLDLTPKSHIVPRLPKKLPPEYIWLDFNHCKKNLEVLNDD